MSLKEKIENRMSELGISPKRSLGQNFLVSERVVERIIEAADPASFHTTTEIGPGLGALTDDLMEKSQNLRLVELDSNFANFWRDQGCDLEEVDALKAPWEKWPWGVGPQLLVSNLPYQISSRLVVDFSVAENRFDRMVLMFQKEVAQRIMARPGSADYGLLTVIAQKYWNIDKVLEAGAVDFMPMPKVASRVLRFKAKKDDEPILPVEFLKFVKLAFSQRRKKLLPRLTSYREKPELVKLFSELGLSEGLRAESLSVEQFSGLYLGLKNR